MEPDDSLDFEQPYILSLTPPPLSEFRLALHETICGSALAFPPGISLKELAIMKLNAQFVARYGSYFWGGLMEKVYRSPLFKFTQADYCWSGIYTDLILAYARVLRTSNSPFNDALVEPFFNRLQLEKLDEGVEETAAMVDLHAYVGGVDCFTHMEYAHYSLALEPPPRLSMIMNQLPQMPPDRNQEPDDVFEILDDPALMFPPWITLKELGIMKLTAQFVARYGHYFRRALMVRVVMIPQFEFMETTHSRHSFFNMLLDAYSYVLRPTKILKENGACTTAVLEVFFHRLQLEKLEHGVETAMVELHAFVGGLDVFAHRASRHFSDSLPPPEPISATRKWLTQPDVLLQRTLGPLLSKYRVPTHVIKDDPLLPHQPVADFFRISPLGGLPFTVPANNTLKELGVMKLTAQFVVRYGSGFLSDFAGEYPQFEFMRQNWPSFYYGLVHAYVGVLSPYKKPKEGYAVAASSVLEVFLQRLQLEKLEKGAETAMVDLNAFMGGIDYFAHVDDINYSAAMPPPQRFSTMMKNRVTQMRPDMPVQPPFGSQHSEYRAKNEDGAEDIEPDLAGICFGSVIPFEPCRWITLEELSLIKMTALFVARYGTHFSRELMKMKRVVMDFRFKFMDPADSRFLGYKVFLDSYSRVVEPFDEVCMATVLKGFFRCLQLEKLEDSAAKYILDLHAFVSGVDCFAEMEGVDYSTGRDSKEISDCSSCSS